MKFSWKIGGEAGFGIATTGLVFSKIATRLGYHIFDYIQYPSLIRGGHNAYEVCVSDEKVNCLQKPIDILICLNKETYDQHSSRLHAKSLIMFDTADFPIETIITGIPVSISFGEIIQRLKGQTIMKNTIALGASLALCGAKPDMLYQILEEQFAKKGQEIIAFNRQFAEEGYVQIQKNHSAHIVSYMPAKTGIEKGIVLTGNDAFSLGAVIGDCRLYAAYPMTPSSSVLATLAGWQLKTGMVVRHSEDEIAVINTALGASYAGVRSAVGTSGGGYALMVEGISLAGVTETPVVAFISQRPGPGTGMPTWTEQGDLLFSVFSGHGEFPKIVLAPGDVEEMIALTAKAFNLADIYQTPVIVLSDMYLSESHQSMMVSALDAIKTDYKINRGVIAGENATKRYEITESGISPRMFPGEVTAPFFQANSYEHNEDGHTTEDADMRIKQVDKRTRKITTYLKTDFARPQVYGDVNTSKTVFVSWGSTKGIVLQAQKELSDKGINTAYIHFTHLFPLDKEQVLPLFPAGKQYILIEQNSQGQFGKLLRQETGIDIQKKILKYNGRPLEVEEIINVLSQYDNSTGV